MDESALCRQFNARSHRCSRSYARSAGQCGQSVTAAPNPGSPDTSYGLAGARDCRGCDQAPCSETAQKEKMVKDLANMGTQRSNLGRHPQPVLSIVQQNPWPLTDCQATRQWPAVSAPSPAPPARQGKGASPNKSSERTKTEVSEY